jgi:hypothetical protein
LVVEAHEPHGVERVYDRETPSVEAVSYLVRDTHIAGCKKDTLIDRTLGERKQLVVRRCVGGITVIGMQERSAHGIRTISPDVVFSVTTVFG